MNKKILISTIFFANIISHDAFANNGYWDSKTVCDYEVVEEVLPRTSCAYNGWFNGFISEHWTSRFKSTGTIHNEHISCPSEITYSEMITEYDHESKNWSSGWFHGTLQLINQGNPDEILRTTSLVEGSCRIEQVWVPICKYCQIP
jgi:hypothetical protein